MLIEDDADIREVLSEYLSGEGYEITSYIDGTSIFEDTNFNDYILALIDLMLPILFRASFWTSIYSSVINTKENKMVIRRYKSSDCKALAELFYNTIHIVNAKDYTKEQLDVWATGTVNLEKWNQSFKEHHSLVAVEIENEKIVGFGDIDKTGYLDRLYIHSDYQRKGIATAICDQLEQAVQGNIVTHASITAKPFFENRGYKVVKEQQVERQGIFLTNFIMEKER